MMDANKAIALRVDNERFYRGVSPKGRLQTAWSLAGATLFAEWLLDDISKAEAEIRKRGRRSRRVGVRVVFFSDSPTTEDTEEENDADK